jgi:hypothetical protein
MKKVKLIVKDPSKVKRLARAIIGPPKPRMVIHSSKKRPPKYRELTYNEDEY